MEMEPGKLFVGGISWDTNEDRLKEYFQAFGDVAEAVIMKDRITGRARGFGFIVFADPSVAEKVVKEKHVIDGRTVEAKKAVPRDDQHITRNTGSMQGSPGPSRTKKIFVGGLASSVTENDFKTYFDQFGTITDVVVMYDHNTQRPRGFGFITFDSEEAVDKVLYKTFHELNGKMVEVKRAVPKELSPGPTRTQFGAGQNYGLNRVNNLLNAYTQGYVPGSIGSYGVRMEGRYSPLTPGRNGYSSFNPADFSMPTSIDSALNPNYGGSGTFGSNFGRGFSSVYNGNPNRYGSPVGFSQGRVGSNSMLNSVGWNLWDSESRNYGTNSANSADFAGSGSGVAGYGPFGGLGTIWGSSSVSGQGGGNGSLGSGIITNSGRNSGSNAVNTSPYAPAKDVNGGAFGNLYGTVGGASLYEDPAWRSTSPELDGSASSFGYGLGNADSLGYVGGYGAANRSNNGIAA